VHRIFVHRPAGKDFVRGKRIKPTKTREERVYMTIRIYNTMKKRKEPFETLIPGKVSMYVCGPTVYDSCHVGHARSVVVFDVIFRYLEASGYEVAYARNFTDVDDKIIARANESGLEPGEIAEKYIAEFYDDMDALNVRRAPMEPRATDHIHDIVRTIEILVEKKAAYAVDGNVFFSVDSFPGYGKLSGRKLDEMEAGARIAIDERKRNPFDFALWKSAKPGEPAWDSPWGKGRPGWHIECTAMSSALLGESIDIHGGGRDLVFPHHENEVAQSEAAFGKRFVKYWVHNGFVNIDHEKMSKSLGNFLTIKDILGMHHPEAVRLFLLSNHYRSPVDFNEKAMEEASAALEKIYTFLERAEERLGPPSKNGEAPGEILEEFRKAMDDDFNTAKALGILFHSARNLNRLLDESGPDPSGESARTIADGRADLLRAGDVLGLFSQSPAAYFEQRRRTGAERQDVDPETIRKMVLERQEARKSKNWAAADKIRDQLEKMNIVLEDRVDGETVWKYND
jgi:cysteinyl-tRNA synthetase